jgi:hypothetical protein
VHLEMRIAFERRRRDECAAIALLDPQLGAAVGPRTPHVLDEPGEFLRRLCLGGATRRF